MSMNHNCQACRTGMGEHICGRLHSTLQMRFDNFAQDYPVGTQVRYYPVAGDDRFELTTIRSVPWELGHGQLVVMVDGKAGGVSIDHIRPASD